MKKKKDIEFKDMVAKRPHIAGVINEDSFNFISTSNKNTVEYFRKEWTENVKQNFKLKNITRKNSFRNFDNIALGKAIIGVGAGQSFNKNKDVLLRYLLEDYARPDRNYVVIASNHQFKPLLKMGIIPDFVMLADASDVVYEQLCVDVPKEGNTSILLAGCHCHPKVLKDWRRQGRSLYYYISGTKGIDQAFKDVTGKNPHRHIIYQGGNVLNSCWTVSLCYYGCLTFIAVGNDLSFPLRDTIEQQRESYYADGDYSSNAPGTGTGRDEAKTEKVWGGFSIRGNVGIDEKMKPKYIIDLDIVGTNNTLWVYKTWIETQVVSNEFIGLSYHYFNCSEGGICGVMANDHSEQQLEQKNNWFLLDEKCSRWHTMKLEDTMNIFNYARGNALWRKEVIR